MTNEARKQSGNNAIQRDKNRQSYDTGGRMWRVRGCARVMTGVRPKKRPTHRGTSLGMVSLAKRITNN